LIEVLFISCKPCTTGLVNKEAGAGEPLLGGPSRPTLARRRPARYEKETFRLNKILGESTL